MFIIVCGNPLGGFTFHGVAPTAEVAREALDALDVGDLDQSAWIAELLPIT